MSSFPLITSLREDLKNSNVLPDAIALSISARQTKRRSSMGLLFSPRQNLPPTSLKLSVHPACKRNYTQVLLTILPWSQIVFGGQTRQRIFRSPAYKVHGLPSNSAAQKGTGKSLFHLTKMAAIKITRPNGINSRRFNRLVLAAGATGYTSMTLVPSSGFSEC